MKKKLFTTLLIMTSALLGTAQAALIVDFDLEGYTNQDPYTTPISTSTYGSTDANIEDSSILLGAGATSDFASNTGDRQLFASFGGTDFGEADTNDDYFSWTVQAVNGYKFTVTDIDITHRAASGSTFSGVIRSSVDSFASDLATLNFVQNSIEAESFTISGVTDQTSVELRLYAWGDGEENFQLRNLDVSGTTSVIPEPSAFALLAGACGLFLLVRRRHLS